MKPAAFRYRRAASLDQAAAWLGEDPDAALLAGGQSLVPMMNLRVATPATLIDIGRITDGREIAMRGGKIVVGGLARHHDVAQSETVADWIPPVAALAATIGHAAIRRRGTIGGSLATAHPAAQYALLATLLDPQLEILSHAGTRRLRARALFDGPFLTCLGIGEIIASVRFDPLLYGDGWGHHALYETGGAYATAAVAVVVRAGPPATLDLAFADGAAMPRHLTVALTATDDARAAGQEALVATIGVEDPAARLLLVLANRAIADAVVRTNEPLA